MEIEMHSDTNGHQKECPWALVVEDNALHLTALTTLLKGLQVNYKRNTTGMDVAGLARSMHPLPSVILLDMDLPYDDSFTVCRALLADPALRHIPILAMGDPEWANQARGLCAAGFSGFIPKPLPHTQFKRILEYVLSGRTGWIDDQCVSSPTSSGR